MDNNKVAQVLVDAAFTNDQLAAAKWGVTDRTVRRYRVAMVKDEGLRSQYRKLMKLRLDEWADEIPVTLIAAMDFIRRAAKEADPSNPEAINAISNAFAKLAEVRLTVDAIRQNPEEG